MFKSTGTFDSRSPIHFLSLTKRNAVSSFWHIFNKTWELESFLSTASIKTSFLNGWVHFASVSIDLTSSSSSYYPCLFNSRESKETHLSLETLPILFFILFIYLFILIHVLYFASVELSCLFFVYFQRFQIYSTSANQSNYWMF